MLRSKASWAGLICCNCQYFRRQRLPNWQIHER